MASMLKRAVSGPIIAVVMMVLIIARFELQKIQFTRSVRKHNSTYQPSKFLRHAFFSKRKIRTYFIRSIFLCSYFKLIRIVHTTVFTSIIKLMLNFASKLLADNVYLLSNCHLPLVSIPCFLSLSHRFSRRFKIAPIGHFKVFSPALFPFVSVALLVSMNSNLLAVYV